MSDQYGPGGASPLLVEPPFPSPEPRQSFGSSYSGSRENILLLSGCAIHGKNDESDATSDV
jgi:hypothetical protein